MNSTSYPKLILEGPIYLMLIKLGGPNLISVLLMTSVTFADAYYVGKIGTTALASLALVFPLQSLMQMMGMGAIGGGIASSVSRAVGRNDAEAANALVWHAVLLSVFMSSIYVIVLGVFPYQIFSLVGAPEESISGAVLYSRIIFGTSTFLWLYFVFSSVLRGLGSIQLVSLVLIFTSLVQIILSGMFTIGVWQMPRFGMSGPAMATVICQGLAGIFMFLYLRYCRTDIIFRPHKFKLKTLLDILRVGGPSSLNSVTIVSTTIIATSLVSGYGSEALAGYGIGNRLEFMLIPLAFGIGGVSTVAVGINFGAQKYNRARRIAWAGAIVTTIVSGLIGLAVALEPTLWLNLFTANQEALSLGAKYLMIVGPFYGFFCGGQTLYFASMGTGNMVRPVAAGCFRLAIVSIIGYLCIKSNLDLSVLFWGIAIGMSIIGVILTWHMFCKTWNPEKQGRIKTSSY